MIVAGFGVHLCYCQDPEVAVWEGVEVGKYGNNPYYAASIERAFAKEHNSSIVRCAALAHVEVSK